jgi:hypothetical protein
MEVNSMSRIYKAIEKTAETEGSTEDHMAETIIITDRHNPIDNRKYKRHPKKLTVRIDSGSLRRSGIMRDVSENGMFVMSSKDLTKDMVINIELSLPNNKTSLLKGTITRNMVIPGLNWLTGAGIKLTEKDETFHHFLTTLI